GRPLPWAPTVRPRGQNSPHASGEGFCRHPVSRRPKETPHGFCRAAPCRAGARSPWCESFDCLTRSILGLGERLVKGAVMEDLVGVDALDVAVEEAVVRL